ncbi:MAG: sensor histidine kinase [Steroidobacteraceae bacterium]|nr:sensor histidine kinase [Steroidobacteraceae bacterium]
MRRPTSQSSARFSLEGRVALVSAGAAAPGAALVAALVDPYNEVGRRFRDERQTLQSRGRLLDTVIQTTPLALEPDRATLERVFGTLEERAAHLKEFIDGYARFAKLPQPPPVRVEWEPFVARLRATVAFALDGELPESPGWFDPVQFEQVLINLLKNAHESGSPAFAVRLAVERVAGGTEVRVLDRGAGMSAAVLEKALLPFYSTKPAGTGLGLTLSREIAEAHGGRLTLAPRPEGGTQVSVWLHDAVDVT